jgi:hypothetical protein
MRNTIKCIVTGAQRITNNSYLGKKADKAGVSVDCLREHYVSKPALAEIKAELAKSDETSSTVAERLKMSVAKLNNILILNGKVKPERLKDLLVEPHEAEEVPEQTPETVEQS